VFVALSAVHVDNPGVSAALETTMTVLAVVSVTNLIRCFLSTRERRTLLLLAAVVLVWLRDLPFATVPAVAGLNRSVGAIGVQLALQLFVSVAFAAAAFAPSGKVRGGIHGWFLIGAALVIGVLGLVELVNWGFGVGPLVGALNHARATSIRRSALALTVVGCSSVTLLAAGLRFLRRADLAGYWLFSAAATMLAVARLQFFAVPLESPGWVTFGDGLRLLAYAMILLGARHNYSSVCRDAAMRERAQQASKLRAAARAAADAERHRLASDLHDGLAQDLAVIGLHAQGLESELGPNHAVAVAARHALVVSRHAIADLMNESTPTDAALRTLAQELAAKYQANVSVAIEPVWSGIESELDNSAREQLVQIAREAGTNALTHGQAGDVTIVAGGTQTSIHLLVADDGSGITGGPCERGRGFGMRIMSTRARALGGRLSVTSRPGGGTHVELFAPRSWVSAGIDSMVVTASGGGDRRAVARLPETIGES
jgi:signal transduction histidine kinase